MHQITARQINKTEAGHYLYVTGLLFEINRSVMHPLGQSLTWSPDDGIGILDFSKMPERAVFDVVDYSRGSSKFKNYLTTKGNQVMKLRKQILGFVTQGENSIGKTKNR